MELLFLRIKIYQDKINFTDEVKTNYYRDNLSYYNDTIGLLSNIKFEADFQKAVFEAIGPLQIIYTRQDLIAELLFIFRATKRS